MITRAICGLCSANCGLLLTVKDGRITKVRGDREHPVTGGYICPKGAAMGEIQQAPDRLTAPRRRREDGRWEELSWEDALEYVAEGLTRVRTRHGAESVAFYVGRAGIGKEFYGCAQRFAQAFGSPNFASAGSLCHWGVELGNVLTYGVLPVPDIAHSRCIVLWGDNPDQSFPARKPLIAQARSEGAHLIVVDPSGTRLAAGADLHLRLLPGTDAALALGMLHVVIAESLYDAAFVASWTQGFSELAARAADFPPERVAALTGVPVEQVVAAARLYAGSQPACMAMGNALELHRDGVQAARAVACLQAVCGNLDVPGGALFPFKNGLQPLRLPSSALASAIGSEEFPLFCAHRDTAQGNLFARAMLDGTPYPLKAMVVAGSNPLVQWPGAARLPEAFSRLELLVVMDTSETATTRVADVVLPATLPVERDEFWDAMMVNGEPRLGFAPAAAEREGAWSDLQFWIRLGQRMGYGAHFPWASSREYFDWRLAPLGLAAAALAERSGGLSYGGRIPRSYEEAGFRTPSGKVELLSDKLAANGHDPLPGYEPPNDEEAFPLVLTSGARTVGYVHSRYRHVTPLRRLEPAPYVDVHPETARAAGIIVEGPARLVSARGSVTVVVRLSDELHPRVLRAPHGWEEANVNLLSSAEIEALDPISGFPDFRSMWVRLEAVD